MWSASEGRLFYPTFWLRASGVDSETLRQAITGLTNRIPVLRTTFANYNDDGLLRTVQVVLKGSHAHKYRLPWSFHIPESKDELLVTFRIHHALYDAVSFQLVVSEMEKLCTHVGLQAQPNTRMSEFVSQARAHEGKAEEFWRNYLGSSPGAYATIGKGSFAAKRRQRFDPTVLQVGGLIERLKQHGISMQALFFAAYARVYSTSLRETGRTADVVIGIYLANRSLDIDGLPELVAPTFNVVPLRVQLGSKTLLEMARHVQQDLGEITKMENCGVSMREIHSWTHVKIDTFVNFLSLPATTGDDENEVRGQRARVTHATVDAQEKEDRDLEAVDSPSPFWDGDGGAAAAQEWCLVS
jgi:hypothetical protein